MTATDEDSLKSAFQTVAHDLGCDAAEDGLRWLSSQEDEWLLILDNADDPTLNLGLWIPTCSHGNVIITSRNPACRLYAPTYAVEVREMANEEACSLILNISGTILTDETRAIALEIVTRLGCLALAVAHAGSYIATSSSIGDYLPLYCKHRSELLREHPLQFTDQYRWSVYTTWEMNYGKLSSPAKYFVKLCAFFHFANIQWEIFERAFRKIERDESELSLFLQVFADGDGSWDGFRFEQMIAQVRSFSLINIHHGRCHSMHPLVHSWVHDRMSDSDVALIRKASIVLLSSSAPAGNAQSDLEYRRRVLDHVSLLAYPEKTLSAAESMAFAAVYFACSLNHRAQCLYRHAWHLEQTLHGQEHARTIRAGSLLGLTCVHLSAYDEAERLLSSMLRSSVAKFGSRDPITLKSQCNLALYYHRRGRHVAAEEILTDLVQVSAEVLGEEHIDTMHAMQLLGYTYVMSGQTSAAEELLEKTAALMTWTLGEMHPWTLYTLDALADHYYNTSRYQKAVRLKRMVFGRLNQVLGPDHEETLSVVSGLACFLRALGHFDEAEVMLSANSTKLRKLYGDRSRLTLNCRRHLAITLSDRGKLEEANVMIEDLAQLFSKIRGEDHTRTLEMRSLQGLNMLRQGRLRDAQTLLETVLSKEKTIVGSHPVYTL